MRLRILPVVRSAVEARQRAAVRVVPGREVAGIQQRPDAGDVAAERERHQVELQLDVLVERFRHADRHGRFGRRIDGRFLGNLKPPFDFAHVLGVLVEPRLVRRADVGAQTGQAARERVQNASVLVPARGALLGRAAVPEHPLEGDLRIQFHRQRRRRRRPRDAVRVRAAVTFAAVARVRARVLDRELHRRHQVVLADLLRNHLVDRRPVEDVRAGGALRFVRAQVRRGHPVIGRALSRRRFRRPAVDTVQKHDLLLHTVRAFCR